MTPGLRSATAVRAAVAALALLAAGCAHRAPPTGGPPDLEPPRIVGSDPDSGAANVPLDATLTIVFSEAMEPRSTAESADLAPRVPIARRHWHGGRTLEVDLAEPLKAHQTYTLFVGRTARDRHGNSMANGGSVVFSTAERFPPGRIAGTLEAKGFAAPGTNVWCYARGRAPDSTARDFDAIGIVDSDGSFRVDGLSEPESYHLWAFADLNSNRSFEPVTDVLAPVDTVFDLTAERPVVTDLVVRVVNPHAPGSVRGTVIDSLADSVGVLRVVAVAEEDSTLRVTADAGSDGAFEIPLQPGVWTLRGFLDVDKNRVWQPDREPASDPLKLRIEPAEDIVDQALRLKPAPGKP